MMNRITRKFDAAEFLDSEEMIAAYLEAAFEEGDLALIRAALSDVVRAKGGQHMAAATGLR